MSLWGTFWKDEAGAVVSAELVAVGTVTLIGGIAGMNMLAASVNSELQETAYAVRSLDQSYSVVGHSSPRAWTAGSYYFQPDVDQSISELRSAVDDQPRHQPKRSKKARRRNQESRQQADDQPAFIEPDETTQPGVDSVEAADDASKMEVIIESSPDA